MVSKCANPQCSTPFHYLRTGKLFQLEVGDAVAPGPQLLHPAKQRHHREHFWLCGDCSASLTLVMDKDRGVIAVPIQALARRAAAS